MIQVEWKDSNGSKHFMAGYKKELEGFVESLEEQGVEVSVKEVKKAEVKTDGSDESSNGAGSTKEDK